MTEIPWCIRFSGLNIFSPVMSLMLRSPRGPSSVEVGKGCSMAFGNFGCLRKFDIFLWRAVREALPTKLNLFKWQVVAEGLCK